MTASGLVRRTTPLSSSAFLGLGRGLPRSTRKGSAMRACGLFGCAVEVTASTIRTLRAPVERDGPRHKTGVGSMSQNLSLAQRHAWHLAKTLMVCVVLFESDGGYGVLPFDEFDGDPTTIIHEYDPYDR